MPVNLPVAEQGRPPMKLHLDAHSGNLIRAHSPGRVVVNETTFTTSLIVLPDRVIPDWPPGRFEDLTQDHFAMLVDYRPEVVILGTGDRLRFPHPALTQSLAAARIGIEVMNTAAACRTYNVLAGDQRVVAAALLMTSPDV
jgi:uncharacterized protein